MSANKRRRAILEALCERRFDTEVNLAFEFGVSKRTIATDILSFRVNTRFTQRRVESAEAVCMWKNGIGWIASFLRISSWSWQSGFYRIWKGKIGKR